MKKYFFILLLSLTTFSQTKGGEAIYGVSVLDYKDDIERKKLYYTIENLYPDVLKTANELSFTLKFNEGWSMFYVNEFDGIVDAKNEVEVAQGLVGYGYKTWQNSEYYYVYNELRSFVGQRIKNFEWKITKETKRIDSFLCYKATGVDVGVNSKRGHYKTPIIAWFCPEIPYSYGPLKFGNLPGLILELQTRSAVFGLKSLTFKDTEIEKTPNVRVKSNNKI